MNVTTIEMDPQEAQEKLDAYRQALSSKHSQLVDEEWRAAEQAYKELAKGTPLIDPIAAIRECGWRPDARPVLAIARADQKQVTWRMERTARWWDNDTKTYKGSYSPMVWSFRAARTRWDRQRASNLTFRIDQITTEPPVAPKEGTAMVPMVPADVIPSRGCDLSKHFILWEVESWDFAPPVDPILLRPIGGNLYAVVAQWDLTEVERLIIAGTRKNQ